MEMQQNHRIRRQLRETNAFSGTSLFFGVLSSVVCSAIIPALGAGRIATVLGAALGPLLVAMFTTRGPGLIRTVGIASVTAIAFVISLGGFTLPEAIAGDGSLTSDRAGTFVYTKRGPAPTPAQAAQATRTAPVPEPSEPPSSPSSSPEPSGPSQAGAEIELPDQRECPEIPVGDVKVCKQIGVGNAGTKTVEIATGEMSGAHADDFVITQRCDGTLKPGTGCSVRVEFRPSASGLREASLILYVQPGNVTREITVTGNAIALDGTE
ncbi:hypothetical protein E0H75_31305 [Kribbella capetownensis]|uniref:Choice-of-anchor D domain-containing protein n=1 Tax=Kribbella capetownensis TaxID=1572659 RepID=A0A4R0JG13_9ACTN|nr:hypothetical protein [Kribbella capetownensis]TCC45010.1 hypothetical protein E0H75_31305 [Kribbella capetownensis]